MSEPGTSADALRHLETRLTSIDDTLREVRTYIHGTPNQPGIIAALDRLREAVAHDAGQTDVEVSALTTRVSTLEAATLGTPERNGIAGRVIALEGTEAARAKHLFVLYGAVAAGAVKAIVDAIGAR